MNDLQLYKNKEKFKDWAINCAQIITDQTYEKRLNKMKNDLKDAYKDTNTNYNQKTNFIEKQIEYDIKYFKNDYTKKSDETRSLKQIINMNLQRIDERHRLKNEQEQ